ncbi:hypothetical protein [Paenibacillus apiarius]|uniref:Uncharacterized protein n=1 Tax=Paenibacillus apiarius TaxID=46240 RepID=A0ABT4DZ62_9BACL|nr:hypothetical protein [Paenibacillus apiarius]MCY9513273.1 hypothetical protein [Paenibacillus apiarius]MCY9521368.1 hypothetical protein [Paenibacillus apiarius]MCY9554486.1 hypothetical protein [Paenibacillus apiarius]MCY9560689.1 hypothetical protein [Paenibacillus apiarius]MCY9685060.1 hypothetical protein [Paenibacillus apiarius]
MKELRKAIGTLEKLQDNTTGVTAPAALADLSWFLLHDLQDVLDGLKQVESEMAAVGAATNSND